MSKKSLAVGTGAMALRPPVVAPEDAIIEKVRGGSRR